MQENVDLETYKFPSENGTLVIQVLDIRWDKS